MKSSRCKTAEVRVAENQEPVAEETEAVEQSNAEDLVAY